MRILILILVLCGGLLLPGFASEVEKTSGSELEKARNERIDRETRALGEAMLTAFRKNDAKKFVSLLPVELRKKFTESEFEKTRRSVMESLGEPVSFQFLTVLDAPVFRTWLWRVSFRRKLIRNPDKEYTQEVLFRVIAGPLNGKAYPVTFGFL